MSIIDKIKGAFGVEAKTYEEHALASQKAFTAGDFEIANVHLRAARDLVADKGQVVQMGDGALQLVPNG